ncbi:MAG: helix-turn-helix domain-containing protein [Candidatus Cryptobacteroides sp.]
MNPDYGEVVAAFGSAYLSGKISQVMQANKFCMVDNLDGTGAGESSAQPDEDVKERRKRVRYPLRISMSFSIYCKSGTISTRIQQKEYNLSEGDMLLIFAGQILESASLAPGSKVIFIAIDSEFILTQIRNRYGNVLRDWVLRSKEPTLIHLDAANASHFEELCSSIKFIIQDAGDDYSDGIVYGFTTIFANLLTSWYKRTSSIRDDESLLDAPTTNAQKVLLRFQSDIHHFSDRYKRVSYYARRQNLSTRRFSQLINEASGRKPSDLISEYLILEAKSYLCTGIYSVHQVCEMLGFDNDSFFNRWFKKAAGTTPGRYV